MAKKPIKVTEVVLRDAHQSLLATRMTMDEMRPILPEMDKINYFSVECWGGATFDSCIRFLDEDPWERLRILRKELPHQKLQMLFRGQNMLGYRPYADDAVGNRLLYKVLHSVICVGTVAQHILAAEQHLQLLMRQLLAQDAQTLPRILV